MRFYHRLLTCFTFALAPAIAPANSALAADEVFAPTAVISLPGGQKVQSFDISFVDPVIGLYILGDRTNQSVDVIDTTTNTVLTQLKGGFVGPSGNNDTSGPDGVLIIDHREVWVGDAPCSGIGHPAPCAPIGSSSVKVIDLFSQQLTHTIFTGGAARSDELCVDPQHHLVLVANNADTPPFASIISTKSYTVLAKIPFDGTNGAPKSNNGAEQCQWNQRTGKFYISIPGIDGQPDGTGGVAVIDPVAMKVEKTFIVPFASCEAPQGMAIGPGHQILLGCNGNGGANHPTAIMSQLLGVVDADSPGDKVKEDQDVFTSTKTIAGRNAHSVAADPILNKVFVPIPAGNSSICGALGGVDANGCIAVFTTPKDDRGERVSDRR